MGQSPGNGPPLRDALETPVESSVLRPSERSAGWQGASHAFPIDVYEDGESYLVYGLLPGVDPRTVEITATGRTIAISAETRAPESAGWKPLRREIGFGPCRRELTLPLDFEAANIAATYEHGLLKLIVPKARTGRTHTIKVQAAG
jgi:HSP20 family protein